MPPLRIVTISIRDSAAGGVEVNAVVDPPMTEAEMDQCYSPAVYLGAFVQKAMKAEVFRLSQQEPPPNDPTPTTP